MDLLVLAQHGSNKEARAALMLGSQRYDAGLQEKVDILLMATRNPVNSPVEVKVVSPIIYRVSTTSQVGAGFSEPSISSGCNHGY